MKQLRLLLQPTAIQFALYVFGSITFLIAVSYSAILKAFSGGEEEFGADLDSFSGIAGDNFEGFLETFDNSGISATLTTLLFWSAAGAVVYIIIWTFMNGFIEFVNSASKSKNYVHGQSDNSKPLLEYIGRLAFRLTAFVVLVAYALIYTRLLITIWIELFGAGVTRLGTFGGWLEVLLAIVGSVISVHLFTILARLVTMRVRVFGQTVGL